MSTKPAADADLVRDFERAKDRHMKALITPELVFDVLADHHVGAQNGISSRALVFHLLGYRSAAGERCLRRVIEALTVDGKPVCGNPADGYFIASNAAEIDATCLFLYSRAMTSLRRIAALKRVALPDFRGQLQLPIEDKAA